MTPEMVGMLAVRLNGGRERGAPAALARAMGVPVKTVRAWMAAVDDDDNHRRLSSTARRLLTLLALLEAGGLLTEEFLTSLESFETLLEGPPRRLRAMLRHLEAVGEDDEE
ncbi:hypothetical protein [Methylobacterium aquaticum]|uniref:Uncharacterized protein n=1 Tax=Methylobacterium aquaticum TaxID=270351 RepID=A0A0C6FRM3_9HYPH|nr:hypothetical protein [Methylobacterium aquaticum]BAQ48064.1 hypothetical protein Maq22A_c25950 [Methylobacterium aquaticum]